MTTMSTTFNYRCLVVPLAIMAFLLLTFEVKDTTGLGASDTIKDQQHHNRQLRSTSALKSVASSETMPNTGGGGGSQGGDDAASKQIALASLLRRRRSMKGGLWGPPSYNAYFSDGSSDSAVPAKRNDEAWIWMPAYGYVPMPTDDGTSKDAERGDRIGNLLRYG